MNLLRATFPWRVSGLFTGPPWALLGALILISELALAQGRPPARVKVDAVRKEPVTQTVPLIGRVVARTAGTLAARIAGAVKTVAVQVGDRVQLGDVLVTQDDAVRRAELERQDAEVALHKARLATARATLALAEQELERLRALRGTAAFPKARYEDKRQEVTRRRSEVTERRADLGRASANRRLAELTLTYAEVKASFAGVVLQRHVAPGAYLRPGDPVVTMLDDLDMELEVDVPIARLGGLGNGAQVTFEIPGLGIYPAAVRTTIPRENALSRTRSVRLTPALPNTARDGLAANQSITVSIPIGAPRTVTSVHKDAVITRAGKKLVYVVSDGAATIRPVEIGDAIGERFEVRTGLAPDELVVIRGNERLRPGQKVQVPDRAPPAGTDKGNAAGAAPPNGKGAS